ncbi:MAG: acyl-CoA thioesterase [Phycisphaeraceae bacterium]|nr:acyl-CoA thioesterase [Phycisphaeraceae bacterium]MBX3365901.1 acyl-CoA thioesterase [Phycisphaeraceae bacterium]
MRSNPPSPISISLPVAWGEMDALGHVNNVVYFRYLECARVEFMRRCGMTDIRQPRGIGVILQHVQCRFRRPIVFPDTVTITARVTSIEADRFTLDHEIISAALDQVAALGTSTIVTYDYTASAKAPIPADLRRAIEALRA